MSEEQQTKNPADADSAGQIDAGEQITSESMATQRDNPIEAPAGSDASEAKPSASYTVRELPVAQLIIQPTIGRKVWFYPNGAWSAPAANYGGHMDATVVYVWSDRMVNLAVRDHAGCPWQALSVTLVQPGDPIPVGPYATWMDFQLQQAAVGK